MRPEQHPDRRVSVRVLALPLPIYSDVRVDGLEEHTHARVVPRIRLPLRRPHGRDRVGRDRGRVAHPKPLWDGGLVRRCCRRRVRRDLVRVVRPTDELHPERVPALACGRDALREVLRRPVVKDSKCIGLTQTRCWKVGGGRGLTGEGKLGT